MISILSIWPFITGVALTPAPAKLSTVIFGGLIISYPDPPPNTSIDSTPPNWITSPKINFLFKLWSLWDPSAKPVILIRFDFVKASFFVFANLTVVAFTLDTK